LKTSNLIKKISFPRLCLPVTVVANALVNFSIVFALFSIFLLISGNFHGLVYLALIPVLAILIAFAIGLGISLGVLNVFFRDVGQLFGIVLQFWFWLTPIVYPATILPESVRALMRLNPMAKSYRCIPGHSRYRPVAGMARTVARDPPCYRHVCFRHAPVSQTCWRNGG